MKSKYLLIQGLAFGVLAVAGMLNSEARAGAVFQVVQTSISEFGGGLRIDNPAVNGKSGAKLIVTQLYSGGVYNPSPVAVGYFLGAWSITNEDGSAIPLGANFNVQVGADTVVTSGLNSSESTTYITQQKKNAKAVLLVTHLSNPNPNIPGNPVNDTLGLVHSENQSSQGWQIFTENYTLTIPPTAFNVADVTGNKDAFVVTTSGSNTAGDRVTINNAVANNNPTAVIFVTPVILNPGSGGIWDHPPGVYYNGSNWCIFNEDQVAMPDGVSYNVEVFEKPKS